MQENKHSTTIVPNMPSLEDIITLKGSEPVKGCINVKKAKPGTLTSRCYVGFSFYFFHHYCWFSSNFFFGTPNFSKLV